MLPPIGVVAPVTAPPLTAVVLPLSACVTSAIDAAVAARVTGATLAAGASFGKKVKSDARFLAVSGVMATGAGMGPVSVTVTRWNAPTLTAGPTGLPVVGSSLVTSTSPRRIVIVERAGEISATTKVPRIAATALGVLISRVSPGFIPALLTATADRPAANEEAVMPEFAYTELLPLGEDAGDPTDYRLLESGGVAPRQSLGREFLDIDPGVLTALTAQAFADVSHLLRPAHLAQLRRVLDDPEASQNDRFVALDLLRNACIAAGRVLPMCQDTGTAIVMGKRGQHVLTDGRDEEHISRGVYQTYATLNLRYSQLAPLTMWDERNTGSNLPAQIEIYADRGGAYKFLFMAKGGGSANKSFLYQETRAVLSQQRMLAFLEEKIRAIGTAACPPYHLAVVVGGTSAEYALKAAKYASAHYLDALPVTGSAAGHGFRDLELEQQVFELTRRLGIGAQFGGKYFCHDVRVIRLPRHGASCPIAIAVSCSDDRQALAKITRDEVFLERPGQR